MRLSTFNLLIICKQKLFEVLAFKMKLSVTAFYQQKRQKMLPDYHKEWQ